MIILKKVTITVILFCLFSLGDWVIQAKSDVLHLDSSFEKLQIQQTTENYFDTRYLA